MSKSITTSSRIQKLMVLTTIMTGHNSYIKTWEKGPKYPSNLVLLFDFMLAVKFAFITHAPQLDGKPKLSNSS